MRGCEEEELEEIYKGQLGIFPSGEGCAQGSMKTANGPREGQRAWMWMGRGVIICGRKMRKTHLPHMYVEWNNPDGEKDATRCYNAAAKEKELESLRLGWSYLRGLTDTLLHRTLQEP